MSQPSDPAVAALKEILEPLAGARLLSVRITDGRADLVVDATGLDPDARTKLEFALIDAARTVAGVSSARVAMTASKPQRRIIVVGSGKGGVGKSTISANLAVAMARAGRKVGLVDADIYGPSQPRLLDCEGERPTASGEKLDPVMSRWGIPVLSMGHLVPPGQAIAWRGPMAGNALGQLIDANWGDVTDIVVDLPPGTGDVQLSMLSKHKPAGAVIVSTPQDLALIDATRAINLFEQGGVPVIGIVENMAGYACPHCGETSDPFGHGGAEAAGLTMGHDFLGRIPLQASIRSDSDNGQPPAAGDGPEAAIFAQLAERVISWLESNQR